MNFNYHFELIQKVLNETHKAVIGLIILSFILLWIYHDFATTSELFFWSFLQATFIYLRYKNAINLQKYLTIHNRKKVRYYTIEFFFIIVYSAIVWDIALIYMTFTAPSPYEFVGFITIAGLTTAAALSFLHIFVAYITYFFMLILPQIFILLHFNQTIYKGVALLCLIYIPVVYLLSKSIYKNSINSILSEEKLKKLSTMDSLTNIYNRNFFIESSENTLKVAIRENNKLSLLMLDIDYFKNINDNFGHHCGDQILVEFSSIIKKQLRQSDIFARLGGEEFGILLSNTSLEGATIIAKKICAIVREHEFIYENQKIELTVSIGISEKNDNSASFEKLYKEADINLYKAKKSGRDQVISSF